ncbi:hypothetical protein [Enterobacter roggenkampii]|nr:hypothetical protein [Enterobacter roggenkampii]
MKDKRLQETTRILDLHHSTKFAIIQKALVVLVKYMKLSAT